MSRPSVARIVSVTAGLAFTGIVVGATLGALLLVIIGPGATDSTDFADFLETGAIFGGAMGAGLAPVAAWLLMRDVPLWRAIGETAIGTVLGCAVSVALNVKYQITWLSPPLAGIGGFTIAAIRLRLSRRARTRGSGIDAPAG